MAMLTTRFHRQDFDDESIAATARVDSASRMYAQFVDATILKTLGERLVDGIVERFLDSRFFDKQVRPRLLDRLLDTLHSEVTKQ